MIDESSLHQFAPGPIARPTPRRPLQVILMGRKKGASDALQILLQHGHEVVAVVAPDGDCAATSGLAGLALSHGIPVMNHDRIHCAAESGDPRTPRADVVISYLHGRRIRQSVIRLAKLGAFNFHPAPLPELRGLGGYNFAILERMPHYGVSVHWIAENIDEGNLVKVKRFPIDAETETALSLEGKSQSALFDLFLEWLDLVESGKPIPSIPQGRGRYIDRNEMEEAKRILPGESQESVHRKARAFWFPPFTGAYIEIDTRRFTIVPDCMLRSLAQ